MANEAVIVELLGNRGDPVRYTCADATGISKGAILQLTDNRTAEASAADKPVAGIAAEEKVANDGATTITCYTIGIFDILDSGARGNVGIPVVLGGANAVKDASGGDAETGLIFGKRFATAGAGGTEEVRVLVGKHH